MSKKNDADDWKFLRQVFVFGVFIAVWTLLLIVSGCTMDKDICINGDNLTYEDGLLTGGKVKVGYCPPFANETNAVVNVRNKTENDSWVDQYYEGKGLVIENE